MSKREEIIYQLLERWDDLVEPGVHVDAPGDRAYIPLMPSTYTPTVRELERLLKVMRSERRSQWWHVTERYLRSSVRVIEVPVKNGRVKLPPHTTHLAGGIQRGDKTARLTVKTWNPAVRAEKVRRGVAWLAIGWSLPHEPMLPNELLAVA